MKQISVSFVKHTSAKSIVYRWFRVEKRAPLNTPVSMVGFKGKKNSPILKAIEQAEGKGCWGFCQHYRDQNQVHFWVSKNTSTLDIIDLFVHEVTHAAGYKSEHKAVSTAAIATFSIKMVSEYFGTKIKLS